jgi:hypothetical protein
LIDALVQNNKNIVLSVATLFVVAKMWKRFKNVNIIFKFLGRNRQVVNVFQGEKTCSFRKKG